MDFRQTQPSPARPTVTPAPAAPERKEEKSKAGKKQNNSLMRLFSGVIIIGVAILLAGIALAIARGNGDNEFQYVDQSKYQAVFLNNGQVYFGNIDNLNGNYVRLSNIYYLTQTGSSTSSNYSLVKLGCQQIHDPYDQMVINRDQVTFWENLNDNGKVVSSINQFKKQNPNGPDCSQVSNQTQASDSSTQGGTTPSSSSTTNSTNSSTNGSSSTK